MKPCLVLLILTFGLSSCSNPPPMSPSSPNLLTSLSADRPGTFQWMNPIREVSYQEGKVLLTPATGSDFFNNPEDQSITATAPFLYQEVEGDFVATARVKPDFSATWNACALMVYQDSLHWIKFAFENSDATGRSIVSVVTREVSDDANGAVLDDKDAIWLKMVRKGDIYSMHWSTDGQAYKMARLSVLPPASRVKVGLEAQCPVGRPALHEFQYFSLEQKTVEDLRKGK